MNKIHLIFSIIILSGIAIFHSSCEDDNKDQYLTPTAVYFVKNGVQELKMYNKGEGTNYIYRLDLYRSGVFGGESSAEIEIMTADELTDYNIDNDTNYELLDAEVYSIEKTKVNFSDNQKDVNQLINVTFDPSKLDQSETNMVLPIKIKSASVDIRKDKSVCIVHPVSVAPVVSLSAPAIETVNYEKGVSNVLSKTISATLDIDQNDWNIDVDVELDADYLAAYNQANNKNYILPDDDMFSLETSKTIEKGQTSVSFSINVFQRYLNGNYMLPIRLKSSSKFGVNQEQHYVIILNIVSAVLSKTNWTIAGFSSEEATGESGGNNGKAIYLIDGNKSTFWHSQWQGAKPQPPHWLVIDMHAEYTLTHIIVNQRGDGDNAPTKGGEFDLCNDYNASSPATATWTKIGDFELAAIASDQTIKVQEVKGRYLRIYISDVRSGDKTTSLAEISARGY